jgi:pimeloyl-ACP methyl ester carboxylesterase
MDLALSGLEPVIQSSTGAEAETPQRGAVVAALNGVVGDHLVATNNPLAIPMQLRYRDEVLEWQSTPEMPEATGKVVVLLHGLCMDDLQRHAQVQGHATDHGETLAAALGYAPVYARYNSGLHTSENGRALSAQLEQLVDQWPVPLDELTIVAHSMGGLVARSAHYYAQEQALRWPGLLKNLVFLGTPHHGALLEQVGNWVDTLLESTPYTAPFARLGRLRSAGITDLRFGYLLDDDWRGRDRFHLIADNSLIVPLPENVACFAVAATRASPQCTVANRLLGDGLVPLPSALGRHPDPERTLRFGPDSQWTAYKTHHMALLYSSAVADKLLEWLAPPSP